MANGKVNATEDQLKALEVFKVLIKDDQGRQDFIAAPPDQKADVVNGRRGTGELSDADYTQLPDEVRRLLENLSDDELALLSRIDATFVDAGLFVTRNPRPLMVH
jgi:hypothetical protein